MTLQTHDTPQTQIGVHASAVHPQLKVRLVEGVPAYGTGAGTR